MPTKTTYWFNVDSLGDPILDVIEVFLLIFPRDAESLGINGMSRVFVQRLRNKGHVLLFESPVQLADEFYLWRIGYRSFACRTLGRSD